MSTRDVRWTLAAERDLILLAPTRAERIIDAVEVFAQTGRGFVRILLDGSGESRLYTEGAYAIIHIDDTMLLVLRVYSKKQT